ncbi:hypothetical protein ABZX95_46435 [Streptomyces sp. NPDC004232]|uniref:hypothetical protein n=1 Tax=Streptomyces sp. NPDC004232 TaxID=3154454 RepID=UPI0033B090D1
MGHRTAAPRRGPGPADPQPPAAPRSGPDAVRRFSGAIGWVVARGSGPVVLDLGELRGRSAEGRLAITEAARRLAGSGRGLEPAGLTPPHVRTVPSSSPCL